MGAETNPVHRVYPCSKPSVVTFDSPLDNIDGQDRQDGSGNNSCASCLSMLQSLGPGEASILQFGIAEVDQQADFEAGGV